MQLSPRGFSKCFQEKLLLDLDVKAGQETYLNLSAVNFTRNGQILTSVLVGGWQ